jgi:hypothetical protein
LNWIVACIPQISILGKFQYLKRGCEYICQSILFEKKRDPCINTGSIGVWRRSRRGVWIDNVFEIEDTKAIHCIIG